MNPPRKSLTASAGAVNEESRIAIPFGTEKKRQNKAQVCVSLYLTPPRNQKSPAIEPRFVPNLKPEIPNPKLTVNLRDRDINLWWPLFSL